MKPSNLLLSIAALAASLSAQCYETQTGASIGAGDDVVLPMQSLGFAFPFGGATYTDVHVSTNGFVYLSNAAVPAPGGSNYSASTALLVGGSPVIAPYWSDLTVVASSGGDVKYQALPGKAVITWENALEFGNTVPFSVQLQLHATGEIDFAYDGRCATRTSGDFVIGMSEGNGATVPAASDYATPGTSATTTSYEIFNLNASVFDLAGQTVQFFPNGPGYVWLTQQCAATSTSYGTGCYSLSDSIYERFANATAAAPALTGQSMAFSPTGGNYLVSWGGVGYLTPSGSAVPVFATPSDDGATTVTPSIPLPTPQGPQAVLQVAANGVVTWGAAAQTYPGSNSYSPTAAAFLNGANGGFYSWHDYNEAEAGSGRIVYEEVATPAGTVLAISWDNVENYPSTTPNPSTMQMQFNLTTGDVAIVWPSIDSDASSPYGSAHLVGYTPPGASVDVGPTALATALPVVTSGSNVSPLAVSASAAPVLGTSVAYTIDNIPANTILSAAMVSLGQVNPGIDLASIGAPGCLQLIDLNTAAV
ncbi:MAG: hypothetical protein RL398_1893, partial [Planctomycetota bacterium]